MSEHQERWYHSTGLMTAALVIVGPLALPLVWLNPKLGLKAKGGITLISVCIALALIQTTATLATYVLENTRDLQEASQSMVGNSGVDVSEVESDNSY